VNRDNALFTLLGLVIGFVAAYPVFEVVSARQPLPHWAGGGQVPSDQVGRPGGAGAAAPPAAAAAGPGAGPAMEEVRRLRERIDANPNDADAVCELARMHLMIQDLPRAKPLLEQCQRLRPQDQSVQLALANLSFDLKDFAAASTSYQKYLEVNPSNADARTDFGVSLLNLGQPAEAKAEFERVQAASPSHWASLYNLAVVQAFHLNDMAAARASVARLRTLGPDRPEVGQLEAELNRRAAAP
jgi:tetratricopeptide (TPR) repeat protein